VSAAARGQVIVEFAVACSILLLMLFGVVDFSRALYAHASLTNAARNATRYAVVTATTPTDCSNPAIGTGPCETAIEAYIGKKLTALNGSKLTYKFTWEGADSTCTKTAAAGCYVRIELDYKLSFILVPLKAVKMKAVSQMVIVQ